MASLPCGGAAVLRFPTFAPLAWPAARQGFGKIFEIGQSAGREREAGVRPPTFMTPETTC